MTKNDRTFVVATAVFGAGLVVTALGRDVASLFGLALALLGLGTMIWMGHSR